MLLGYCVPLNAGYRYLVLHLRT